MRENRIVRAGKLLKSAAVRGGDKNFVWHGQAGAGGQQCFRVSAEGEFRVEPVENFLWRGPNLRVHCINRLQSFIFSKEIDGFTVGEPSEVGRAAIKAL